jgi:hypothetical protein
MVGGLPLCVALGHCVCRTHSRNSPVLRELAPRSKCVEGNHCPQCVPFGIPVDAPAAALPCAGGVVCECVQDGDFADGVFEKDVNALLSKCRTSKSS